MKSIKNLYRNNVNGLIITLLFHIVVFGILYLSHLKIENHIEEEELIIDIPFEEVELKKEKVLENNASSDYSDKRVTNYGSNKAISKGTETSGGELQNEIRKGSDRFDKELQNEIDQAQNLVKEVKNQLSRNIPIIPNLKMPTETTKGINSDSIQNKQYIGDSNIEYFLADRYHVSLPIPVYLAQMGGKVKVNIQVNANGDVVKADPIIDNNSNDQLLSFAKTAAILTKFNAVSNSKNLQSGYIVYRFVAQ